MLIMVSALQDNLTQNLDLNFEREFDELIPRLMTDFPTEGAAVGVIHDGKVMMKECFGWADREHQIPVDTSTLFNVASISKSITAFGIVRLAVEGQINLDEPVEIYLKRWKLPSSGFDHSGVTIRRILSHSAGLTSAFGPGFDQGDVIPTIADVLSGRNSHLAPLVVSHEPGTRTAYSNGGYALLQLLIEEVSGMGYKEFMHQKILPALGMHFSNFDFPSTSTGKDGLATRYSWRGEPLPPAIFPALAAGGLNSSLHDLMEYVKRELCLKPGPVSCQWVKEMQAPSGISDQWGLGHSLFQVGDVYLAGHSGLETGWNSLFLTMPEMEHALIVLTNNDNGYYIHRALAGAWIKFVLGERTSLCNAPALKKVNRLESIVERGRESGAINSNLLTEARTLIGQLRDEIEGDEQANALSTLGDLIFLLGKSGLSSPLAIESEETGEQISYWLRRM
jgi:CubicO group peptidase (beta-lactamase class C family)